MNGFVHGKRFGEIMRFVRLSDQRSMSSRGEEDGVEIDIDVAAIRKRSSIPTKKKNEKKLTKKKKETIKGGVI